LNQKGYSLREIASQMNCSKSTVDNYLKKQKEGASLNKGDAPSFYFMTM